MTTEHKRRMFHMPQGERFSLRDMFLAWWPVMLLVAAGFGVAAMFVKPAPPDHVVIAAGAEDGAYYYYAGQYADYFDAYGIKLEVRTTSGSVENFSLLSAEDSDIDVAFIQDGVASAEEGPDLESLGAMYYEPVWVFYRGAATIDRLSQLKGKRLAIGPEGSGTRRLAKQLLFANAVAEPKNKGHELTGDAAARALREGRIDAAIIVASPRSSGVRALLGDRRVRLASLGQTDAYTKHFPHLSAVVLPRGGIDLLNDIPPHDVHLVATTANLVVRYDLHPAIVKLMAAAAKEVHGVPGLFNAKGAFPDVKDAEFPMNGDAERYYKSGPPFLQRYLPFWAAIFVDRMIVFLVPLIALALPLARLLPALYQWRVRSRIYRNYGELKFLEAEVAQTADPGKTEEYLARLDKIEDRVHQIPIPLAYQEYLYTLRGHIDLVRARIAKLAVDVAPPSRGGHPTS
jgi:TRAP transporter TAXI family solute receptor